jgi:hypothetical protein
MASRPSSMDSFICDYRTSYDKYVIHFLKKWSKTYYTLTKSTLTKSGEKIDIHFYSTFNKSGIKDKSVLF